MDDRARICKVEAGTLTGSGGRKTKKPVVHFDGKDKGLALCKTNAKTVAALYEGIAPLDVPEDETLWIDGEEVAA